MITRYALVAIDDPQGALSALKQPWPQSNEAPARRWSLPLGGNFGIGRWGAIRVPSGRHVTLRLDVERVARVIDSVRLTSSDHGLQPLCAGDRFDVGNIRHLHLKDPVIIYPGATLSFMDSALPILRIRLAAVDGWMLGRISVIADDDDDELPDVGFIH